MQSYLEARIRPSPAKVEKAINDARISDTDREAIRHNNAARAIAKVKRPMSVAAE